MLGATAGAAAAAGAAAWATVFLDSVGCFLKVLIAPAQWARRKFSGRGFEIEKSSLSVELWPFHSELRTSVPMCMLLLYIATYIIYLYLYIYIYLQIIRQWGAGKARFQQSHTLTLRGRRKGDPLHRMLWQKIKNT